MNCLEVAQRYLDAWSRRDAAALVAVFADGGTYSDPVAGTISGQAIGTNAARIFNAFPDITLETLAVGTIAENTVAVHWRMPGTNTGSFAGLPPTGKSIVLPGASIIAVADDRVASVNVYFDAGAIPKQLGMQVLVQPRSVGRAQFGYSVSMHGKAPTARPAAFSLTSIQVRSDTEAEEVRAYARRLYPDLCAMKGFISILSGGVGHRLFTASAWEDLDGPRQLLRHPVHREAAERLLRSGWAVATWSSLWAPISGAYWTRCPACQQPVDFEKAAGACICGATLPPPPPYW